MIGLCLIAVFAIGAVATTSASAAAPEFGRCVKKAKAEGSGFSNAGCTAAVGSEAKWEWLSGAKANAHFTSTARFVATQETLICRKWEALIDEAEELEAEGKLSAAEQKRKEAAELLEKHKLTAVQCEANLKENEGEGVGKEPVLLETVTGHKVECSGVSASGEYTSAKTVSVAAVTFTGCEIPTNEAKGIPCTSAGAKEGEIVTSALEGTLGVIKKEPNPVNSTVGLSLAPATLGGNVAEFECGPFFGTFFEKVVVTGSVIHQVEKNKMLLTENEKYIQKNGVQKPESFDGEGADVLETSIGGGTAEQSGEALLTTLTNEEKIEVNSVV